MSSTPSPLQPLDASAAQNEVTGQETEKISNWVVRHIARSMAGRVVMSAYETLRATSTSVICLSPVSRCSPLDPLSDPRLTTSVQWGDSSPLLLPCIRFRDVAVSRLVHACTTTNRNVPKIHTAIVATVRLLALF